MNGDRVIVPVTRFDYRHPLLVARVRIGVGVWLLILTGLLLHYGQDARWLLLLLPAAALNFYLAYRMPRAIRARTSSRDA
jgi:hypothetical protein